MRVKEGDETKKTAVEKEGDGTVERSVFEEAQQLYSDMQQPTEKPLKVYISTVTDTIS